MTHQHFTATSPSPNTILYTVSSLSQPRSRLNVVIRHILRIIFAFYTILTVLIKAQRDEVLDVSYDWYMELLRDWSGRAVVVRLSELTEGMNWWVVIGGAVVLLYLCAKRDYVEESMLVMQGLGVQISTSSTFYLMEPMTKFIPTTQIQDLVIHEAFKGFGVRFYLAIIVQGATEVVVVFPDLLPRRAVLEEIWRGSRKCLYGGAR